MKKETKIIIYRENLLQSVLADLTTFGMILLSFGINHLYIGSKFISGVLLIMLVFWIIVRSSAKKSIFHDKEEAIKYINK